MKAFLPVVLLFCVCNVLSAQNVYQNKEFGIRMQKPLHWIVATNDDYAKAMKNIDFTNEQLASIVKSNKGILTLATFYKYKLDSVAGLIPTIKVTVRSNPTDNFADFKSVMIASTDQLKTILDSFRVIDDYKEIQLSHQQSLSFSCRYLLKIPGAKPIAVRTRFYNIPKGKYFVSLSFMDDETDDCSALFDQVINTLQLE